MSAAGQPPATVEHYRLRLFVAGTAPRSLRAVEVLRRICEAHVPERYELEIIDIYQQPDLAQRDGILAAPTLLRLAPGPERRISGDLLDESRILRGLEIASATEPR